MDRYPEESSQVKMGTVAYHAERELVTLMISGYRHVPEHAVWKGEHYQSADHVRGD